MPNHMKLINLNQISAEFAKIYYDNNDEDIAYDILEFAKKVRLGEEIDHYSAIKMLKAIMSYCGTHNVDINKYFRLKI